jgi:UDP:flavonoid glycosyltransferase YjiC (YdhE family)
LRDLNISEQIENRIFIYEAFREEGYDISYPTVSNYINKFLKNGAEAFIKSEYSLATFANFIGGKLN